MNQPTVDRWGFYEMDAEQYHSDPAPRPSLSSSQLATIVTHTVATAFQEHPRLAPPLTPEEQEKKRKKDRDKKFDLGSVAHTVVLGKGRDIVPIDADNWTTKAAKEARDQAFDEGKTPCLAKTLEQAHAMRTALMEQLADVPGEQDTFTSAGESEMAGFCQVQTELGKLWGRALFDWKRTDGRLIIRDYKTFAGQTGADPDGFFKYIVGTGKDVQAPWYSTVLAAIMEQQSGAELTWEDVDFSYVVQDPDPPYLVSVVKPAEPEWSFERMRWAIDRWVAAAGANIWRGFVPTTHLVHPPGWAKNQWELRMLREFEAEEELRAAGRPALALKDPEEYRIPDDMISASDDEEEPDGPDEHD